MNEKVWEKSDFARAMQGQGQKHTPEPWQYHLGRGADPRFHVQTQGGYQIASTPPLHRDTRSHDENTQREANARRIVVCVNACAGIPTEALEAGVVGELLAAIRTLAANKLSSSNCSSVELAGKRVRNVASPALAKLEAKP